MGKKREKKNQFPCLNTEYSLWGTEEEEKKDCKGLTDSVSGGGAGTAVSRTAQGHHVL